MADLIAQLTEQLVNAAKGMQTSASTRGAQGTAAMREGADAAAENVSNATRAGQLQSQNIREAGGLALESQDYLASASEALGVGPRAEHEVLIGLGDTLRQSQQELISAQAELNKVASVGILDNPLAGLAAILQMPAVKDRVRQAESNVARTTQAIQNTTAAATQMAGAIKATARSTNSTIIANAAELASLEAAAQANKAKAEAAKWKNEELETAQKWDMAQLNAIETQRNALQNEANWRQQQENNKLQRQMHLAQLGKMNKELAADQATFVGYVTAVQAAANNLGITVPLPKTPEELQALHRMNSPVKERLDQLYAMGATMGSTGMPQVGHDPASALAAMTVFGGVPKTPAEAGLVDLMSEVRKQLSSATGVEANGVKYVITPDMKPAEAAAVFNKAAEAKIAQVLKSKQPKAGQVIATFPKLMETPLFKVLNSTTTGAPSDLLVNGETLEVTEAALAAYTSGKVTLKELVEGLTSFGQTSKLTTNTSYNFTKYGLAPTKEVFAGSMDITKPEVVAKAALKAASPSMLPGIFGMPIGESLAQKYVQRQAIEDEQMKDWLAELNAKQGAK